MLEFIYNSIAVIGFILLLMFAWLGFKFVAKALTFASEMALLDWKYQKAKGMTNDEAAAKMFEKIRTDGEKDSK